MPLHWLLWHFTLSCLPGGYWCDISCLEMWRTLLCFFHRKASACTAKYWCSSVLIDIGGHCIYTTCQIYVCCIFVWIVSCLFFNVRGARGSYSDSHGRTADLSLTHRSEGVKKCWWLLRFWQNVWSPSLSSIVLHLAYTCCIKPFRKTLFWL